MSGEVLGKTLEKEFKPEMLLCLWTHKLHVSVDAGWGLPPVSAPATDPLFLVVVTFFSGQKINQTNRELQAFICFNYF